MLGGGRGGRCKVGGDDESMELDVSEEASEVDDENDRSSHVVPSGAVLSGGCFILLLLISDDAVVVDVVETPASIIRSLIDCCCLFDVLLLFEDVVVGDFGDMILNSASELINMSSTLSTCSILIFLSF